jgi:hypothetical protein
MLTVLLVVNVQSDENVGFALYAEMRLEIKTNIFPLNFSPSPSSPMLNGRFQVMLDRMTRYAKNDESTRQQKKISKKNVLNKKMLEY